MNLSLFSSQDLRRLADLVARKEEFLQAAAQIDSELAAITDPGAVPNVPALPPPSTPPTAERGFVDVFPPALSGKVPWANKSSGSFRAPVPKELTSATSPTRSRGRSVRSMSGCLRKHDGVDIRCAGWEAAAMP